MHRKEHSEELRRLLRQAAGKKAESRQMIVDYIERLHRQEGLPYRELCAREGVGYTSLMRWRRRPEAGETTVSRPGPAKVEALDLDRLRDRVAALREYTGGVERDQGEIKERLRRHGSPTPFLAIQDELYLQALNHKRRRGFGRRTPCEPFNSGRELARTYTRPKRKEVYAWIEQKTLELTGTGHYNPDRQWRQAVQTCLWHHFFTPVLKQ